MNDPGRFRIMLLISVGVHVVILGLALLIHTLRLPAVTVEAPADAQFVELYQPADVPELADRQPAPETRQVETQEKPAFQTISSIVSQPTPTPTPPPVATATPKPRPTPTPAPTPTPVPTPTIRVLPTPTPRIQRETQWPEAVLPTPDPPKREPVIQPRRLREEVEPVVRQTATPLPTFPPTPIPRATRPETGISRQPGPGSRYGSADSPMTFETEDRFPYPEYLTHIKEKIEGLWFPEGHGTVSIYLIIDRNGKILKSGVDKGTGLGVEKLRESIVRALSLIKRFHPLPQDYDGIMLRVRITVRR